VILNGKESVPIPHHLKLNSATTPVYAMEVSGRHLSVHSIDMDLTHKEEEQISTTTKTSTFISSLTPISNPSTVSTSTTYPTTFESEKDKALLKRM